MGKGNGMATGQPPDFTKAKEYFHRAAKQNSADGHFNLGALYKDGQGVEQVRGYTWLCMVIHGYAWLYMVMHGYTWLYMKRMKRMFVRLV